MFKCTFQATLSNTSTLEKGSARTPLYKDKRVGEHTEGQGRTGRATTAFDGAAPLKPFNGYMQACSPLRTIPAFHCWYHVFYKNNGEAQLSSKPLQWLICIVSALSLLDSPYTRRQVPRTHGDKSPYDPRSSSFGRVCFGEDGVIGLATREV